MTDYSFDLLTEGALPRSIDWPGIKYVGIAMYNHNGQGTRYLWYLTEKLVSEAKTLWMMHIRRVIRQAGKLLMRG